MLVIARHQIISGLKDAKFIFMTLIVLLTFIFNATVYSSRYASEMEDWQVSLRGTTDLLESRAGTLRGLSNAAQELLKPPAVLAFISDSGEERLPNSISGNAFIVRNLNYLSRGNEMHSDLPAVDWNFIIGSLMSLMAVLISFGAICGEKRDGTLCLVLSNPVSRLKLFFGKFIGLVVVLLLALFAGIAVNVITSYFIGQLPISIDMFSAICWVILASSLYLLFILLAGIGVSSMTRRPAISLVILLVGWILIVIAIPGLARVSVEQAFSVRSFSQIEDDIEAAKQALWDSAPSGAGHSTARGADNMVPRTNLANACLAAEARIRNAAIGERINQTRAVHTFSHVSPAGILASILESLSGTGITGFSSFIEKAHRYRRQLHAFVVGRDEADPQSPHLINSWGHYSEPTFSDEPVELAIVPRWQGLWSEEGLSADRSLPVLQILLLLAVNFLIALVAFVALARYDPR